MTESDSNRKGKNIWPRIGLDQFVAAVASLGDRSDKLKAESWRLTAKTKSPDSLWGQVIDYLKLDNSESKRQALYKIWWNDSHEVSKLVEEKKRNTNQSQDTHHDDHISDLNQIDSTMAPNFSLPLPQPPKTRAREKNQNVDVDNAENNFVGQISIIFFVTEWKNVFSRTNQKMKDDWTKTFREKLTSRGTGITCSLKFISDPYFKEGKGKRNCRVFSCTSKCTIKGCKRKYIIVCPKFPDENSSILFLVKIFGKEDHTGGPNSAQLRGKERLEIGERANNIGPLAVYRELIENATGVVIKKLVRQKQVLLYAMMFKDGDDSNDTIPLAHAITHQIRGTDILPSFYIIDFSAALMNAILEAFNVETVNAHLNRCWNVINAAKERKDELIIVDEYLRSSGPIIHYSPFNWEAVRLYPNLTVLINKKLSKVKSTNPLYSPSLIRIFYRWWTYLPFWTGLLFNFKERYPNNVKKTTSSRFNPVRHSNALIESYFRTMKKSIFQNQVYSRPYLAINDLRRCINIQFKAKEYNVTVSSKGRKRKKRDVSIAEQWDRKGKGGNRRTAYLEHVDKYAAKRVPVKTKDDEAVKVIKKISESEDTSTASSYNQSSSSSTNAGDSNVASSSSSSTSNKSIPSSSSSLKANSSVSNDFPIDIPIDLDMPMDNKNRQNDVSFEYECENHSNSSIASATYPVANPSSITTDHGLSKTSSIQDAFQPEADIFGMKLRWPKFEIKNVPFESRRYTLTLTYTNMRDEMENALPSSPYSILLSTFRIVEKEGWDAARISWLLKFNLLKTSDRAKSLFGSVDELVFCFLKNSQRHSTTITCTNPDCTNRKRVISASEIRLFPCDDCIENFEAETTGVCGAMIERYDEMIETKAIERKYRDGRVPFVDNETDEKGSIRAWICDHTTISSVSEFENELPLVLIANLEPFSKRSHESYEPNSVRLRDMRKNIKINSTKYQLRATIHHKDAHFTATLIDPLNRLYIYDDQKVVREVRGSTDMVKYGLYVRIPDF
ncbi:hypothetical protein I4U23_016505 [Adineta vaga]|nr:hypothetical protein I4U23_016505 [Adineta vaga]